MSATSTLTLIAGGVSRLEYFRSNKIEIKKQKSDKKLLWTNREWQIEMVKQYTKRQKWIGNSKWTNNSEKEHHADYPQERTHLRQDLSLSFWCQFGKKIPFKFQDVFVSLVVGCRHWMSTSRRAMRKRSSKLFSKVSWCIFLARTLVISFHRVQRWTSFFFLVSVSDEFYFWFPFSGKIHLCIWNFTTTDRMMMIFHKKCNKKLTRINVNEKSTGDVMVFLFRSVEIQYVDLFDVNSAYRNWCCFIWNNVLPFFLSCLSFAFAYLFEFLRWRNAHSSRVNGTNTRS